MPETDSSGVPNGSPDRTHYRSGLPVIVVVGYERDTVSDWFGESSNGSAIDVAAFLDSNITGRIARIVAMGCLVSIGTTRDRGAVSINLTQDGRYRREYFRRSDDAVDWLDQALRYLEVGTPVDAGQAPARRQKATRGR